MFESALKSVDATFQNLDSSEISLTDVSHYFDSDPTKLVSGLRTDGKLPSSYIADTTTANAQVRYVTAQHGLHALHKIFVKVLQTLLTQRTGCRAIVLVEMTCARVHWKLPQV